MYTVIYFMSNFITLLISLLVGVFFLVYIFTNFITYFQNLNLQNLNFLLHISRKYIILLILCITLNNLFYTHDKNDGCSSKRDHNDRSI